MSFIIFDGNTYTFGATVSANPGTGTTSYVFGGLSSGATFGFILRAFNGFGFSNFVGPTISKTLQQILETRDAINAFSWSYQHSPSFNIQAYVNDGNTYNFFAASENLGNTLYWRWATTLSGSTVTSGITAPDGSTTAWDLYLPPNASSKSLSQTVFFEFGNTYIVSFYLNLSTSLGISLIRRPVGGAGTWEQIDAQTGLTLGSLSDTFITIPPGATSWTRFNFRRYHNSLTSNATLAVLNFGGTGVTLSIDFWGPQLEIQS
jgi:hypothetical protein